jgi:enterochelin esterase-like enzyme
VGSLVDETLEGRSVTVFVPDDPPVAIVYAADGQGTAPWGADLTATMVVGIHGAADDDGRLAECSPGFDPERFAAHERLFVEVARAWVRDRFAVDLPVARTAVFGASAGGELALALGLRHPDVYGVVLAGSPGGGYRPPASLRGPIPRTYLVAGTDEPWFLENATRWADALRAAGADVELRSPPGGHGPDLWRAELPLMTRWAFGP